MRSSLAVWMNGEHVGTWSVHRGSHRFVYARSWLDSPRRRSLSLSLPITPSLEVSGPVVANYFENLLPDNDRIRERISRRFRTRSADAFDLLQAIGRDCVGAVQLLPEGASPQGWDTIASQVLSEPQVAQILRATPTLDVLGQDAARGVESASGVGRVGRGKDGASGLDDIHDDAFRISLAGAQEKTALLFHDGAWRVPLGATPSTHILKLPLGLVGGSRRVDLRDSIENEWLCAQILYQLGLSVAVTEMWRFEDCKALVLTRFDRELQRGVPASHAGSSSSSSRAAARPWIARLPQEDLCQAMGLPPDSKYEKDGGPGIARCMQLLAGSADPGDVQTFALVQLAFWLLGATDGHAKNFSIFLRRGDAYTSTPLYDVLSIFPYLGQAPSQFNWRRAGAAMAVRSKNAHWYFHDIQPRHWQSLALKYGGQAVWEAMTRLVQRVEPALARIASALPADFPPRTWERIEQGMLQQAGRFQ